ncbi:hypothetical protein EES43_23995 [Streptomyces sp. ADI96-02]|nr:hypothetical protein EES43_23995 [Streptomyces sp. ADI96-02]
MAEAEGMSQSAVARIWRAFGLKPHIMETWKLSTDPQFVTKVLDMVGIYLTPPENALVLAVDEKSQIQALDRTQPVLPMAPTTPAKMTHDYVRHGTTSLFAALDIASGSVIAQHPRFHLHFTPTSASWLNPVGCWFAELPCRKLRRSTHRSVVELERDIRGWINEWNKNPKPFAWTKTTDDILDTLAAHCTRMNDSGH